MEKAPKALWMILKDKLDERFGYFKSIYARILYDLGIDTVEKVSKSDPIELHTKVNWLIKEKDIFKGQSGLNDIKILIEAATEIPKEIEY